MWVFSKDGFFSIVQHKDDSEQMVVRARVRQDLVDAFGDVKITESTHSDYRFRVFVSREKVGQFLASTVADLNYDSVKDNIDKDEEDRHKMLYAVWRAHWDLQHSRYPDERDELDGLDDWYELIWKAAP